MKRGIIATVLLGGVLTCSSAHAVFLDDEQSIQVTGKVFTQASLRMIGSDSAGVSCYPDGANCTGFTFPDTKTGQLIQHRNLLDAEMYHDVAKWLGPQFSLLDQLGYRVRVKWFYDGVYDYGPTGYSHAASARTANAIPGMSPAQAGARAYLANILYQGLLKNRDLDTQKDPLWNAYLDLGKGPVKFRIGRQDLSWGETDGFRLLDMIEPLDNRFGFPLVEDLDDRRIPLWMVRPTLSLGSIGPIRNLTVDGYWVPGSIDNEIAPVTAAGNPFGVGAPPGPSEVVRPKKDLDSSRGGGRLIGTIGDVTFSLGHYVTFNDIPSIQLRASDQSFYVNLYQQQITGASATFALPFDPYTIIRTEVAQFWDERVFIPDRSLNKAFVNPNGLGDTPTRDTVHWLIGADRNVWIRWLNPENTFYLSGQYFHTHILDYQNGIANAVPSNTHFLPPSVVPPNGVTTFDWVPRLEDEITLTYVVNTLLWHGTIQPQIFGAYDARGVNTVVPSLSYQYGTNLVMTLKYAVVRGTYANLGFFRDRDQLLFRVQYNLS